MNAPAMSSRRCCHTDQAQLLFSSDRVRREWWSLISSLPRIAHATAQSAQRLSWWDQHRRERVRRDVRTCRISKRIRRSRSQRFPRASIFASTIASAVLATQQHWIQRRPLLPLEHQRRGQSRHVRTDARLVEPRSNHVLESTPRVLATWICMLIPLSVAGKRLIKFAARAHTAPFIHKRDHRA